MNEAKIYADGVETAYAEGITQGKADTIKAVLEIIDTAQTYKMQEGETDTYIDKRVLRDAVKALKGGEE